MATPREQHAAATLYDGTVRRRGFSGSANSAATAAAEIYNPFSLEPSRLRKCSLRL